MTKVDSNKKDEKKDDEIIYINVAGDNFATLSSTIESIQGTKLYDMLTKKGEIEVDKNGVLFIDRPSKPFENILNALRTGRPLYIPENPIDEENLMKEVQFYGLSGCFKETQSIGSRWKIVHSTTSDFTITGNTIQKTGGSNSWTNCWSLGSTPFTNGRHYWEWKINYINSDGSGTVFGITKAPTGPYFSTDIGVGMSGSNYGGLFGTGIRGIAGDRIGILVDFKTNVVKAYLNGKEQSQCQGMLSSGVSYYPVIHMYYTQTSFTLSFPKPPK